MRKSFVENNNKLTDNEVILLINNGEYENLQIIINRYLPLIIKTAKEYCPQNLVEDAVQEATFALYQAVKDFEPEKSSFSAFALLCIKRSVLSQVRKMGAQKNIPNNMLSSIEELQVADNNSPEDIFIEKENYKTLTDNIELRLSSLEYNVLQFFLAGKTYSQIAKSLKLTEKSVDNALSRIRKKLKK